MNILGLTLEQRKYHCIDFSYGHTIDCIFQCENGGHSAFRKEAVTQWPAFYAAD